MSSILCVETSIGKCSVALKHNNVEDYIEAEAKFVQNEQLFVLIKKLLERNQCDFKDLAILCCTVGPGSFTGIRIGLAAIKGMGKILNNTKLLGVSTIELMVSKLQLPVSEKKIFAVLNATTGDLYAQEFDSHGSLLTNMYLLSQESLKSNCEDALLLTEQSSFICDYGVKVNITAKDLLKYVDKIILQKKESSYENLQPMYLKEPNITTKVS